MNVKKKMTLWHFRQFSQNKMAFFKMFLFYLFKYELQFLLYDV